MKKEKSVINFLRTSKKDIVFKFIGDVRQWYGEKIIELHMENMRLTRENERLHKILDKLLDKNYTLAPIISSIVSFSVLFTNP